MTCSATPPHLAPRAALLHALDGLSDRAIEAAGRAAITTHGGTLLEPRPGWGPLEYELTLIGVQANGTTLAEALRTWCKRARRTIELEAATRAARAVA